MKNVTWILLILVLAGQAWVSARIAQNERALITAVYILQAGITLEELAKMNAEYAAKQNKSSRQTENTTGAFRTGNPGVFTPSAFAN